MLNHLSITNYAIIESLEIDLSKGFTVITGETGSGKSIVLGALSLILGQRADTSVLNNKEKKCVVEGSFLLKEKLHAAFFEENDLDFDEETILRREINSNGKSRAFINDTPVGLSIIKELSSKLIDVHSQHETLNLKNNQFQIKVLDAFAGLDSKVQQYKVVFSEYQKNKKELKELIETSAKASSDLDYITFQVNEIEELKLKENEKEEIEEELSLINNSEEIKTTLNNSVDALYSSDNNITQQLKSLTNQLYNISNCSDQYKSLYNRLNSVLIEIEDISSELNALNDDFNFDPENLAYLSDRIGKIYAIEQKHNLSSTKEILGLLEELQGQLNSSNSLEEQIKSKGRQVELEKEGVLLLAKELSEQRKNVTEELETEVISRLTGLGMEKSSFKVLVNSNDEPNENGLDDVDFMFSANEGFDIQPLNKVASGGELSRLMLVVKMFLMSGKKISSIIFDEIDTGVSGDIADKMGEIMSEMAKNTQVMAITHLPQVAAKGDYHYKISKKSEGGKTLTSIDKLDTNNRIQELAKMLSGKELSQAAIKNAEALLISN